MLVSQTRLLVTAATFACAFAMYAPATRAAESSGDTPHKQAGDYPPDNSGKNVRDRDAGAVTAGQQSNAKMDVKISQEIRRAVVADKQLSTKAHNVKIITKSGVVTLRGPVNNADEKKMIGDTAQRVAGVTHVNNKLEVVTH